MNKLLKLFVIVFLAALGFCVGIASNLTPAILSESGEKIMDYERLKIKSYKHWDFYLHENQCYLGRVFVPFIRRKFSSAERVKTKETINSMLVINLKNIW